MKLCCFEDRSLICSQYIRMQAILVAWRKGFCADFLGESSEFQVQAHSSRSDCCQLHLDNKLNKHKHERAATVTGCLTLSHLHSNNLTAEQKVKHTVLYLCCTSFFCAPKLSTYNVYMMNPKTSLSLVKLQIEVLFLV